MGAITDLAALLDEKVNNALSALKVQKVSDALWARQYRCVVGPQPPDIDVLCPDCLNATTIPSLAGVSLHMGAGQIKLPVDVGSPKLVSQSMHYQDSQGVS